MRSLVKSKTVWIVNQYASTPSTGMGGRHYYLARALAEQGLNVYLIASSFGHKMRNPPQVSEKITVVDVDNFKMVWVKLPSYKGSGSPLRVLNWFRFAFDLRLLRRALPEAPDVIYYSSPSLIGYLGAEYLANKIRTKLVFEVRDIWPLTLQRIGGYAGINPLIFLMARIERRAYKNADILVSNLRGAVTHIEGLGGRADKFFWIPNGIQIDEVSNPDPLASDVLKVIPRNRFIVGYTGAVGKANALEDLIEAAVCIEYELPDVLFVLVGGGERRQSLQEKVSKLGLKNILFIDPIPKSQVQSVISLFDVCYLGWLDDPLYEYGIGANKIPEYLFSGKPILHSYSGAWDPVAEAGAGITVPAEAPLKIAEAIVTLHGTSIAERAVLGSKGRERAVEFYDFKLLARRLSDIILEAS